MTGKPNAAVLACNVGLHGSHPPCTAPARPVHVISFATRDHDLCREQYAQLSGVLQRHDADIGRIQDPHFDHIAVLPSQRCSRRCHLPITDSVQNTAHLRRRCSRLAQRLFIERADLDARLLSSWRHQLLDGLSAP